MPARVLDAGGGTGVHAEWLSADGYAVELLDPVPRHVQRAARLAGVSARLGDARPLPVADASQDAVLLLGHLYHLPNRADRVRTLTEARRALRPGGVIAAATINRHAAVHDAIYLGHHLQERQREAARAAATNGITLSPGRGFPAYLHDPDEVPEHSPTRAFRCRAVRPGRRLLAVRRHRRLAGRPGAPSPPARRAALDGIGAVAARGQRSPAQHRRTRSVTRGGAAATASAVERL
ncbi:class I SAM-dependent methyltransferase [Nonomuraea bangladeshensis]|uniref:class I SAM-dependent methyltransferase n=1 Tax=Nonomuraea bangladeshensis TaxID=404385 RepID=UPI003CD07192